MFLCIESKDELVQSFNDLSSRCTNRMLYKEFNIDMFYSSWNLVTTKSKKIKDLNIAHSWFRIKTGWNNFHSIYLTQKIRIRLSSELVIQLHFIHKVFERAIVRNLLYLVIFYEGYSYHFEVQLASLLKSKIKKR